MASFWKRMAYYFIIKPFEKPRLSSFCGNPVMIYNRKVWTYDPKTFVVSSTGFFYKKDWWRVCKAFLDLGYVVHCQYDVFRTPPKGYDESINWPVCFQ